MTDDSAHEKQGTKKQRKASNPERRNYVGAARISILPNYQIYLFQDRETIKRIFKNPAVGSPVPVYTFAIQRFFGMPERTVKVYRGDNSGSGIKPHPESNVSPDGRSFHATHKGLLQGLTGPGLGPNSRRYIDAFSKNLYTYDNGRIRALRSSTSDHDWVEVADMFHFIQHTVGTAMIEAHFGPTLLRLSPGYMDDLWKVDAGIPWFSRRIPRCLVPEPYRARGRMIKNLMDWYQYAREHFDASAIDEDGDGDPVWGSRLSRYRQETLPKVREHDDRAIASLDVGHSWGATSNVVATTFMAAHHILMDAALLSRVRESLGKTLGTGNRILSCNNPVLLSDVLDPKLLYNDALLCSIYAEILRLHGMAHFLVSAPEWTDLQVGRWMFPRGSIGVLNSGLAHMDSDFWNTRHGQHPVSEFWPDRFIVDPRDPESGPVNPAIRETPYSRPKATRRQQSAGDSDADADDEPYFSMDGTEGSWFPYGGGAGICLGRFLAKNAILMSLALIVMEFEIEPQAKPLVLNPWRWQSGMDARLVKPTGVNC
ncbi:nacht and ankyrin domain protein [Phlyctema vagabunda]|uniref:Nacht and ankyrin domain protein n=1 Tax=Phlyctema vagabunda TaxID=108571 RepID=A0ABR4PF75_9HELO